MRESAFRLDLDDTIEVDDDDDVSIIDSCLARKRADVHWQKEKHSCRSPIFGLTMLLGEEEEEDLLFLALIGMCHSMVD